ncbi:MAG: hypothetical protein ACREVD_02860, partial [Burkholderiales bacterium]
AGAFPVGSVVELNSGESGIVIAQNPGQQLKPTVVVVREADGRPVRSPRILFLDEDPKARSGERYRIRRTLEQSRLKFDPRALFRSG